jgi:oxygen-independent coproporphyrinogen-3 oxidase
MIDAIKKELEQRVFYLADSTVQTIYFGGGTPSLLSSDELMEIWAVIEKNYKLDNDLEITL